MQETQQAMDALIKLYEQRKEAMELVMTKHELVSSAIGYIAKSTTANLRGAGLSEEERESVMNVVKQLEITREYMDSLCVLLLEYDQAIKMLSYVVKEHSEP